MKKVITFICIALTSAFANAGEIKFVNADGSSLSEVCIAAVDSRESMHNKARELGVKPVTLQSIVCNGKPLPEFVSLYRGVNTDYVLNVSDEKPETQLCAAALTSKEAYENIKETYFAGVHNLETAIYCNNMPLKHFVRKHQNKVFLQNTTASL